MGSHGDSNLVWKIAAGVFIALATLGMVRGCLASYAEQQAMEQTAALTRRYARRQVGWFNRYTGTTWIDAAVSISV